MGIREEHLNKVKNKYGDNITVTGHSLGGSKSEQLARSNPKYKQHCI